MAGTGTHMHAPGFSSITLCRPMRSLESLCKLCTVQLRPRPYLNVHAHMYVVIFCQSLILGNPFTNSNQEASNVTINFFETLNALPGSEKIFD